LFGVQYLHSMGVCHRDLKPENVMLDEAQRCIKIIDFGVSAVFRSVFDRKKRLVNGFCGSQPYIPPEEYDDTHDYDGEKVDVWACGKFIYLFIYLFIFIFIFIFFFYFIFGFIKFNFFSNNIIIHNVYIFHY